MENGTGNRGRKVSKELKPKGFTNYVMWRGKKKTSKQQTRIKI